jgi:inner centromere protein
LLFQQFVCHLCTTNPFPTFVIIIMEDAALSEYEVKRRRRVEENKRMLASLKLPAMKRASPRPQPAKPVAHLEPTRRSSRQQKKRAITQQEEQEKLVKRQQVLEEEAAVKKKREVEMQLKRQKTAKVALEKQQRKAQKELKRKQQHEMNEETRRKKQTLREIKRLEDLQIKMQFEAEQRRLETIQRTRAQQRELEKQNEPPPEVIAQRNADIQRFIQEELDKQARLAKERKEREMEQQKRTEAERVQQHELLRQLAAEEGEAPTVELTAEQVAAAAAPDLLTGEFEFEFML